MKLERAGDFVFICFSCIVGSLAGNAIKSRYFPDTRAVDLAANAVTKERSKD